MFFFITRIPNVWRNREKKIKSKSWHKLYVAMWYVFFLSTLVCLLHIMLTQKKRNNNNKPTSFSLSFYLSHFLPSSLPQQHIYTYIKCTYVLTYLCLYVAYVYEGLYNFEDSTKTMPRFLFFFILLISFQKKISWKKAGRKEMDKKKYLKKRLVKEETRRMFLLPGLW